MKTLGALALLVLALAATPGATAQNPTGVAISCADLATPIPYQGTGQLTCDVTVGCAEFLAAVAGGNLGASGTVTVVDPPAWLTSPPTEASFDPSACVTTGGSATTQVSVPLTVSKDAPGVVDHTLNLTATVGGTTSAPDPALAAVAYHVNYTLVPDVAFPLAVNGTEASFNVTVTQASNARSMVMMEQLRVSAGTLSGPASEVYENSAGQPASKTFRFTYRPPATEWTNATATFTAFGHYLLADGRAGDFDNGTVMTFTFTNATPPGDGGGKDDKGLPAPAGALLALGLVALAALVRRKA